MNLLSILAKLFRATPAPAPERPPDTPAKAVSARHRKVQSCSNAVTVESFDPATGKTVKRYPSIGSAASDGFDYAKVQVASLYGGIHKGLGWRRVKRDDISAASSRTFTPPARAETPDVASVLLTDALRRDELARLRKDVFFDENRHEWGVRLKGRTLHRPERHEVVRIWYDTPEQERRPGDESIQGPPPDLPRQPRPSKGSPTRSSLAWKPSTRKPAGRFVSSTVFRMPFDKVSMNQASTRRGITA